jgi:hypothetical protein
MLTHGARHYGTMQKDNKLKVYLQPDFTKYRATNMYSVHLQ